MELTPDQVQSVNILLSAVQVAQQRGAFSLQDAHTLQEAVDKLVPRAQQNGGTEASDLSESEVSLPEEDAQDDDVDSQPAGDSE